MKQILFLFIALPIFASGQNYLFEITPTGGEFRLLVTDNTRETYPRQITDYGLLDTASFQAWAYNVIEDSKSRHASLMAQTFLADLKTEQVSDSVGSYVALDYAGHIATRYANTFDANYQYEVRGTAVNLPIYISGNEIRRQSNNNLLATFAPNSANWLTVTVEGTGEVIQLFQFGNFFVGRNALDQVVTLKRL